MQLFIYKEYLNGLHLVGGTSLSLRIGHRNKYSQYNEVNVLKSLTWFEDIDASLC